MPTEKQSTTHYKNEFLKEASKFGLRVEQKLPEETNKHVTEFLKEASEFGLRSEAPKKPVKKTADHIREFITEASKYGDEY